MSEPDPEEMHLVFLSYESMSNLHHLLDGVNEERFLTFEKIPLSKDYVESMREVQDVLKEKLDEINREAKGA